MLRELLDAKSIGNRKLFRGGHPNSAGLKM
jgi:hypothetical protein